MAIIRESPRAYTSTSTSGVVSASSGQNYQWPFLATYLRIENLGTVDLWVTFNTTSPATTSGMLIRSCEPTKVRELQFDWPVGPAMVSLAATSTALSGASVSALGLP